MNAADLTRHAAPATHDRGVEMRQHSEALRTAIARANEQRAAAFRETIGALWRFADRPRPLAPVSGDPCLGCPAT